LSEYLSTLARRVRESGREERSIDENRSIKGDKRAQDRWLEPSRMSVQPPRAPSLVEGMKMVVKPGGAVEFFKVVPAQPAPKRILFFILYLHDDIMVYPTAVLFPIPPDAAALGFLLSPRAYTPPTHQQRRNLAESPGGGIPRLAHSCSGVVLLADPFATAGLARRIPGRIADTPSTLVARSPIPLSIAISFGAGIPRMPSQASQWPQIVTPFHFGCLRGRTHKRLTATNLHWD
jgi:hypothetical protein